MLKSNPQKIETILSSSSLYEIPVYQREYKWGKEEALELIEDIMSYMDERHEQLFLGNLILEKSKGQKVFVVDGQQRLTTIIILLIACRMRARELELTMLEGLTQQRISFVDSATGETLACKLVASESVREILDTMADQAWTGKFPLVGKDKKTIKRKVNKIKPIYDAFVKKLSDLDEADIKKFLRATYESYVASIEVENEVEALSIFERTNARGLDLEVSDLLKNFLFTNKVDGIEELWTQIVDNSSGALLRMLKYFYVSKKGYISKPQLYKKLKGYAAEVEPKGLTEQLAAFSEYFKVAKSPTKDGIKQYFEGIGFAEIAADQYRYEKINRALEGLKEFNVSQFCPPSYAAIDWLIRHNSVKPADAKKLIQLFEALEKYHFINNVICERVGNEVEKLYADACNWYAEADNFHQTTDRLIAELKTKLAKEDEFVASFKLLSYSSDQISLISYIMDRFNNFGLEPGQCLQIYNPDPKIKRRNHNIEHFLPQKPEAALKTPKADLEMVDNIGNLLVIYFKDNSRLGNASPAEKIKRLRGDMGKQIENLRGVTDFIKTYGDDAASWDADKISKRAYDLALKAYNEVWKIN